MKSDTVEDRIGIVFKNKNLLYQSLVHRSSLNENPDSVESNERLEFLGDAVLEFMVSKHLFEKFPKQDEGHLTALRAKLVNRTSLASTARTIGLGQEIKMSRGEEQGGGRVNPGILGNTVEALLGAIFLDQGVEKAEVFVNKFILSKLPEIVRDSLKDPKSMFQEFVQAQGYLAPTYHTIAQTGPDHARIFTIEVKVDKKPYAQGTGPSKQIAAQNAAEAALARWSQKSKS